MTEATTSAFLSYRWAKMKLTMAEGMEAERRMMERVIPWTWKRETISRARRNPTPIRKKAPAKAREGNEFSCGEGDIQAEEHQGNRSSSEDLEGLDQSRIQRNPKDSEQDSQDSPIDERNTKHFAQTALTGNDHHAEGVIEKGGSDIKEDGTGQPLLTKGEQG